MPFATSQLLDSHTPLAQPSTRLRRLRQRTVALALSALLGGLTATAAHAEAISFILPKADPLPQTLHLRACIFDLAGTQGQIWSLAKDLALEARKWNVDADLRLYTDEHVAAEDYKAGQCDLVTLSLLRAKQFNFIVGSIDAPGNLTNYDQEKVLLSSLMSPAFAKIAINGPYQVAAIAPIGSIFVMVNDRQINSIEKAAGKKVAVLEWDKSQAQMIAGIGAQPVPSDITNFAGKFNNGQVDIIAAPAVALQPLELYKGLGTKGAIFRFPLLIAHGVVMIRRDKLLPQLPDLDARLASLQQIGLQQMDVLINLLRRQEAAVPARYWLDLAPADNERYQNMLREARIHMTKEGVYAPMTMKLLKRVRCKFNASAAECSQQDE